MQFWKKFKDKHKKAVVRIDTYQEAISFAQAGATAEARELLQTSREDLSETRPDTLLVLAKGSRFSREMREYALDMAQRLGYEILALNSAPIKKETWRFFNLEAQNLREEFKSSSEKNFETFQNEADEKGVSITHLVKFIDKEEALQELKNENLNPDFIISDSEPVQSRSEDRNRPEQPRNDLCVYTLM